MPDAPARLSWAPNDGGNPRGDDRVERPLAVDEWVAEPLPRLPAGLAGAQAVRPAFLFDQRQMRFELLPQVVVEARAANRIPEPAEG